MADDVFKILIWLKRRPGMSVEEFRDYYENKHRKVVDKYVGPGMAYYARRYIDSLPHIDTKELTEPEFDVITEMWFSDKEAFEGIKWMISEGELPADVLEDEYNVFDRPKTRFVTVTEYEG